MPHQESSTGRHAHGADKQFALRAAPLLLLLLLSAAWPGDDGATPAPQEAELLQRCFNGQEPWEQHPASTFEAFLKGQVPRLHLHRVWWSGKRVPGRRGAADDGALSLFTAATLSRLASLAAQCQAWPGVLSAAVYVPVPPDQPSAPLDEAAAALQQLFDRVEADGGACVLRLLLLGECVEGGAGGLLARLLPINALRNAALLGASTPLVAMVDVDLVPSAQLARLLDEDGAELRAVLRMCQEQRRVVVLPAFETGRQVGLAEGQALVKDLVARGDKAGVLSEVRRGRLIPFAQLAYPRGHNATDFERWYALDTATTAEGAATPTAGQPEVERGYAAAYQVNYEPWFVVARLALLPYDARFRGYGWNKAVQVAHHNMTGFTFWVHPTLFLLHRPHPRSEAQGVYVAAAQQDGVAGGDGGAAAAKQQGAGSGAAARGDAAAGGVPAAKRFHRRVAALRHVTVRDMRRGEYKPVPGHGIDACHAELPWWASRR